MAAVWAAGWEGGTSPHGCSLPSSPPRCHLRGPTRRSHRSHEGGNDAEFGAGWVVRRQREGSRVGGSRRSDQRSEAACTSVCLACSSSRLVWSLRPCGRPPCASAGGWRRGIRARTPTTNTDTTSSNSAYVPRAYVPMARSTWRGTEGGSTGREDTGVATPTPSDRRKAGEINHCTRKTHSVHVRDSRTNGRPHTRR